MDITKLFTERLVLRQWKDSDYLDFANLNADPSVMEFYPNILSSGESDAMADKLSSLLESNGWGFWAVEERANNHFIGFVGLHQPTYDLPVTPCIEIGWRLAKKYWGFGYATEAAKSALNFAFTALNKQEIYSFTSVENYKSRSVMERIGMQNINQNFEHPILPIGHPLRQHVLYKIDSKQWSSLRAI